MKVNFSSLNNSANVVREFKKHCGTVLHKLGEKWNSVASTEIESVGAVDTGEMRASLSYFVDEGKQMITVGSPLRYALYVTMGTWKMDKRPFMHNSILNNIPEYQNVVISGFKGF